MRPCPAGEKNLLLAHPSSVQTPRLKASRKSRLLLQAAFFPLLSTKSYNALLLPLFDSRQGTLPLCASTRRVRPSLEHQITRKPAQNTRKILQRPSSVSPESLSGVSMRLAVGSTLPVSDRAVLLQCLSSVSKKSSQRPRKGLKRLKVSKGFFSTHTSRHL